MTDRKLDEAVARVLGWTRDAKKWDGWRHPEERWFQDACPRYSTQPSAQAEMLAWLSNRAWEDECSIIVVVTPSLASASIAGYCMQSGATINEALARLVVAVAESEAKP